MTRTKASSNFALCAAMVCASITGVVARAEARSAGPLSTESFQIGNSGTVCEAQGVSLQGARQSIFDRKWALLCRDAAAAVGSAFRFDRASDGAAAAVADALTCEAGQSASIEGLGAVTSQDCRKQGGSALWRSYSIRSPKARFVVQGLAGYDSALRLALRSLVADRQVPGEVAVVSTGEGGGLGQAKSAVTDPAVIIGQGYRRNNSGAYAEADEMFEPLSGSGAPGDSDGAAERERQAHEMKVNRALQLSNLGEFEQSARLFSEVRQQGSRDPVQSRLGRNFEAIDALNRRSLEETFSILDRPVAPLAATLESEGGTVRIDRATAAGLNTGDARQNSAAILGQEVKLSIPERVAIIDAQAEQIRGTAQRLGGLPGEAVTTLTRANAAAMAVRDGRVVSITRLRAQILSELAVTEESRGNKSQAEGLLRQALTLVETQYPDSTSLNGAKARLAGFLARNGRTDEAMGMFKGIVSSVVGNRGALAGLSNLLQPYFIVLAERAATDPLAVSDLFTASQLVERPGAADTMAQLSRQLEAGSGPAADQFRQSLALGRDIERGRIHIAQANAKVAEGGNAPQQAD